MAKKSNKSEAKKRKAAKGKGKGKPSKADLADRHLLYQNSVQVPEADVEFYEKVFKEQRGRKPLSLREDFCGSAYLSAGWVASNKKRTAHGIDLEAEVLAWGREHNLSKLTAGQRKRIQLSQANVLEGVGEPTDIGCAMNFSYGVFKQRHVLREYFRVAREKLVADGLFFLELYGGYEAICAIKESRKYDGFKYHWEQESYNPITHETLCHIHYSFDDGSRIKKAFTYDWRLWSIPELRELMQEVGFEKSTVYWEVVDDDGESTGEFEPTEEEENQESWLCYIVASK